MSTTASQTMTRSAPIEQRPGHSAQGRPPRDLVASVTEPANLARIVLLGGAFVLLFRHWFWTQHKFSWGSADWSHAYFVPLISLWLLWQNREWIERTPARVFWPGLIPMLVGIPVYVFFLVTPVASHWVQGLAMLLTLFGLVLLLTGPRMMEYLFFPIGYLAFGMTVPEKVMLYITFPLQNIAAQGAYAVLATLQVPVAIAGNVLVITDRSFVNHPLNVAEQCSGMRMVIAFLALGAAVALVSTRMWWKRVLLLSLATPTALLLNVARVAVLGFLTLWNPDLATGEAHTFIGTLLLIPGLAIYLLMVVALNKAVPESDGHDADFPPGAPTQGAAA